MPGETSSELTTSAPDLDLEPGQVVGEYVVENKLGQGGFGAVFRATHPLIGKMVAIKVLARKFSVDPEMVARFVAEARAVNQIRHRNIIDIFSFGQLADGRHYYVMEYLEGDPLDAILERDKRMPIAEALPILRAMARALDACHAKGIAHRDLKPANIFLARDPDGDRYPKLLDFGIAKLMGPEDTLKQKTRTGIPMGTPYYMSPEQCRGRDVDHRTDFYAFGVVAYELLTGTYPIDGDDYMTILMRQISDMPEPPSARVPELPAGIDDGIMWLMAKDPSARPPNLITAIQALEASAEASGIALPVVRESSTWDAQSGTPSGRMVAPSFRRSAPMVTADTRPNAGSAQTMPSGAPIARLGDVRVPIEAPVRKSRLPLIIGGVAVLAAAIVAVVVMSGGAKPAAPVAKAPEPKVEPPAPKPEPTPTPPVAKLPDVNVAGVVTVGSAGPVTITISGVPEGTEVVVLGKVIGTAPGPVQLTRGTDKVVMMLRADGYQADSKTVTPDHDQPLETHLKKKGGGGRPTTPTKQPDKDDIAIPVFK